MRTILSFFLVLLFVASCGGSGEQAMEIMREMPNVPEPGEAPSPDPTPQPEPEPEPPIGRTSCASPPLTADFIGEFFSDDVILCTLGSDGTLATTVCTDGSTEIGVVGTVTSGIRAAIDTIWADLNNNDRVDVEEVTISSPAFPISGNLNLENNRETMSITNLRVDTNFWAVYFRGDCIEDSGSSAVSLDTEADDPDEDVLEILNEAAENLFDLLAE